MKEKICEELKKAIKVKPFYDVVGGCGVDTSNGESPCMDAAGIWFKYCPFCGKKLYREYKNQKWTWGEINQ